MNIRSETGLLSPMSSQSPSNGTFDFKSTRDKIASGNMSHSFVSSRTRIMKKDRAQSAVNGRNAASDLFYRPRTGTASLASRGLEYTSTEAA